MKRIFYSLSLIFVTSTLSFSQEICNNGIDDDGDGFIDCFDPDCSSNTLCDGFYLGNDASCEATPSTFPVFSLTQDFASINKTANHLGRIAIGDLDRDGIPEIATQNRYTDEIYLLNGNDASVKYVQTINNPRWRIAMANVEDDACGEVYAVSYGSGDYNIVAFDCQLNQLWQSEIRDKDPLHMGFADFDQDGKVEMYYKDEVRDPVTGVRLIKGVDTNWDNINGGPVAVDILGDSKLEFVSAGTIYSVNLGTRTADAGTLSVLATMPGGYRVKNKNSATSVADYNQDGFLDVIISGEDSNDTTTVFFWDVQNNVVKTFSESVSNAVAGSNDYLKGWKSGTGRLNIGDMDGDGFMNVSYVSGKYLYALDENWNLFWRVTINEETSGYTGCTLFDFNGDGKMEVVYRDEQWLYIINGNDGSVNTQNRCVSRTNVEYPIVADVDADGATELCIVCGTDDALSWANFNTLSYSENSQVRIFKSSGEPWVPARRVWNQHGYFNVNVNDNLSIPQFQQDHHLEYSSGICTVGPNRPLNGFLNQSPFLNSDGCPTYASPDIVYVNNSMSITPPNCPDSDFIVTFQIENLGDVSLSGDFPISFYNGDPTLAGATLLSTEIVTINALGVGGVFTINNLTITGPGSPFTVYVVLNDAGTTVPTPISLPNSNFLECDYNNNIISASINPIPFSTSVITTDNLTCSGGSVPPNGSAKAFRLVSGVEETADYDFNWFNGTVVSATPDYIGAIYSGLSAGTYTVFSTHKTAMCNSDTVQVTIIDNVTPVTAVINKLQANTDCVTPTGQLSVTVNGGAPAGNFDFEWYVGNTVGGGLIISMSDIASNLSAGIHTVLVTEKATGCQTIQSLDVDDGTSIPIVSATATDIVCSTTNSGIVSATIGGITTGFSFDWYIGSSIKPTSDYTGDIINSLGVGQYTVVATNTASNCTSLPVTVSISQTTPPVITGTSSTNNTSCDPTLPNGSVSMTFTGNLTDFTVEWFTGANTNPPSIGTGTSLTSLIAGVYTVKLTEISTGCSVTDQATVTNNIVVPTISATTTDVTACSPFNGSITVTPSYDTPSDYTFSWYDGNAVKATPDYTETGNILTSLEAGVYTVKAFHNTLNCVASSIIVTVLENTPVITITQNSAITSLPTSCSIANGELVVDIVAVGNISGFDVDWYLGPDTSDGIFFSESAVTTSTASTLLSNFYTIIATNLDNNCQDSETFFLPFADAHQLNVLAISNATTCVPNNDGTIQVQLTPTTLAGFDESDYDLNIYMGTDTSVPPLQTLSGVAGTSNYTFSGLSTDNYTIEAIETNVALSGCSVGVLAEIGIDSTDPVIATTSIIGNSGCIAATADGSITLTIDGGAIASNYTFSWYEGASTTANPLGTTIGNTAGINGEVAENLSEGIYTVEVLNNITQCSSSLSGTIISLQPVISMSLTFQDQSICGSLTDGSASVSIIFEDGTNDILTNYSYEWLDSSNTNLGITTPTITSLPEGLYYVTATNNVSKCSVTSQFTIENDDSGDPMVSIVNFQNPTQCKQPTNLTGEIEVSAVGISTTGYNFEWYAGTSATGAIIDNDNILTGQNSGFYTIKVIDQDSPFCVVTETYELITEIIPITISTSASPLTNCATPDGSIFATVTSGGSNNYNYDWTDNNSTTIGSTKNITGLSDGDYTVIATDVSDSFCATPPITVTISNEQITPILQVIEIAPLTVCDLSRANGVARATVENEFIGYTFEWFEGTTTTGNPIYTGSEYSQLEAKTYTVKVTNNVSQCSSEIPITITSDIPQVPDLTIEVVSNVTSCVADNGSLSVSVDGVTSEYTFDWYIGNQVTTTPDFVGEIYADISIGLYTVVATSLVTGCVSEPQTAEIIEEKVYPEVAFEIGSSTCDQSNGYITLIVSNGVEIESIEWSGNGLLVRGPNLLDAPAGIYTVTIKTALGCEAIQDNIEIQAEVNPFNGISRNGDSINDKFNIGCITDYPENIVKIYNRSGTLVYEAIGYDNNSVYFDGVSNKGMNLLGTNLPDGTYFYVIDKKNGLKPINGYLEIVK